MLNNNNNNYEEMNQGIDRITQILQRQSVPVQSSPLMPQASPLPVNLLNAIASASMAFGQNRPGSNFVENVQKYQESAQNQEINQQKNLLAAYEAKLKMGDAQTKALDDKIALFTGNDPEGKALFLQKLHEDPEPIDPTNSYQVMTKLAGIKKQTGYESPDLTMQKQKDQLDIDLKRAQIGATNALGAQRGNSILPKPTGRDQIRLGDAEKLTTAGANVEKLGNEALDILSRYETGKEAKIRGETAAWWQIFSDNPTPKEIEDYQRLDAISKEMGAQALQQFGGNDTDRELQIAIASNVDLSKVTPANKQAMMRKIVAAKILQQKPAFMEEWLNRAGTLTAKDPETGETFSRAWMKAQQDMWDDGLAGYGISKGGKSGNAGSVSPNAGGGSSEKTIVKTQFSPSTGKRKIIYSDGTEEIQ